MKWPLYFILSFVLSSSANAQSWTSYQIEKANTAKDIKLLTMMEKEVITYVNLCRLYPQQFLEFELSDYYGTEEYGEYLRNSNYRESLINTLRVMEPVEALNFNQKAYLSAQCFAKEQGLAGSIGHTRISCKNKEFNGECCSYGMKTAKDVVMQLLIDHNVPSLGHRKICLDPDYKTIGVSIQPHSKWDTCAVLDLLL